VSKPVRPQRLLPEKSLPRSSRAMVRQLKALLKAALAISRQHGKFQIFLEVFAGCGNLSSVVEKHGMGAVRLDINDGINCLDKRVYAVIRGWVMSSVVAGIWMGTPCSSWSRARHDLDGGGPRSQQFIWGKPNLSEADSTRVLDGNNTLSMSMKLIRLCLTGSRTLCPIVLENPATSYMWSVPSLQRLVARGQLIKVDYCQFGCRWRKRTSLCFWNFADMSSVSKLCHGRSGICSRTHQHHIQLKGVDPKSKRSWTKIAEPYPPTLCVAIAKKLLDTFDFSHLHRLQSLVL
jgi:hypothetical protein